MYLYIIVPGNEVQFVLIRVTLLIRYHFFSLDLSYPFEQYKVIIVPLLYSLTKKLLLKVHLICCCRNIGGLYFPESSCISEWDIRI